VRAALVGACVIVLASVASASAESLVYLMYPPLNDRGVIAPEQPLHRWRQIGTFATLNACQVDDLRRYREAEARRIGALGRDALVYAEAIAAWAQTINSLCVASNDPRLGGRP
jgi:hypothetical protein